MAKEVYSPSEIWVVSASYLPEKHTSSFSFSFQPRLWSWFWVFWNKKHASDFLLGSHLTVPNQSNKNGSQHSQNTIPWHFFFSHGMVHCFLGVSLQRSKNVGQHVLMNLGIGVWWQKKHMSIVEAWELQIWTCQKNMLVHFSLYCQHLLDHRKSKGIPLAWRGNPLQYSCLENPMDGRS